MSGSRRGIDRERQVRAQLEADGWWVARAAGSFGDADLVASRSLFASRSAPIAELRLIEVKSTAAGPFHSFGPKDRAALIAAADRAGATAWLVWWPRYKPPKWLPSSEWPQAPEEVDAA